MAEWVFQAGVINPIYLFNCNEFQGAKVQMATLDWLINVYGGCTPKSREIVFEFKNAQSMMKEIFIYFVSIPNLSAFAESFAVLRLYVYRVLCVYYT